MSIGLFIYFSALILICLLFLFWQKLASFLFRKKVETNRLEPSATYKESGEEGKIDSALHSQAGLFLDHSPLLLEENRTLHRIIEEQKGRMETIFQEREELYEHCQKLEEEAEGCLQEQKEKIRHKNLLLQEYQKTITEQRRVIESRSLYIHRLERQVEYLMDDVKNLLKKDSLPFMKEWDVHPGIENYPLYESLSTPYDLAFTLQRYIKKVESLTGVDHVGYIQGHAPRFLDCHVESYAVDKRRLLDSCKEVEKGVLFILSLLEQKFVFIHPSIKNLVGWSAEKVMKDFGQIVAYGYGGWKESLAKIEEKRESPFQLSLLNKKGGLVPIQGYVGTITKGPFAYHAIGFFLSAMGQGN